MSPIGAGRTVFIYELSMIFMSLIGVRYCSRAPTFVLELLILLECAAEECGANYNAVIFSGCL